MEGDTTWAGKYIDGGAELLRNLTYTAAGATTQASGGWQQHRLGYDFAGPRHLWRLGPLEGLEGLRDHRYGQGHVRCPEG